ncbi:unnamed protein product [Ixodes pacificus]
MIAGILLVLVAVASIFAPGYTTPAVCVGVEGTSPHLDHLCASHANTSEGLTVHGRLGSDRSQCRLCCIVSNSSGLLYYVVGNAPNGSDCGENKTCQLRRVNDYYSTASCQ